jgi:putative DNA methylase
MRGGWADDGGTATPRRHGLLPIRSPKKLIEVALPLDDINVLPGGAREVDPPRPPQHAAPVVGAPPAGGGAGGDLCADGQRPRRRARLLRGQEQAPRPTPSASAVQDHARLVLWENTNNEEVLARARAAIRRAGARPARSTRATRRPPSCSTPSKLPAFHDPFAGGGALPLEAQRLGLESHASDLNPVAVTINKAMIEIPPKFAGRAPVGPPSRPSAAPSKATSDWPKTGPARAAWPKTCAATAPGCASRRSSASATCTRRSKSLLKC